MGTPVFLHILQKRYHCPNCRKHFNETFESVDVYQRQTLKIVTIQPPRLYNNSLNIIRSLKFYITPLCLGDLVAELLQKIKHL